MYHHAGKRMKEEKQPKQIDGNIIGFDGQWKQRKGRNKRERER
jgi:hypothetical protein